MGQATGQEKGVGRGGSQDSRGRLAPPQAKDCVRGTLGPCQGELSMAISNAQFSEEPKKIMRSPNPKGGNDFNCVFGSSFTRGARRILKKQRIYKGVETSARGLSRRSAFLISMSREHWAVRGRLSLRSRIELLEPIGARCCRWTALHLAYPTRCGTWQSMFLVARGRACLLVYTCLSPPKIAPTCPMSDPSFRHLAAFLISFWNKQIGSNDCVLGGRKA
jgi:hypothetical protein